MGSSESFWTLLKKGNKSSLYAMLGNAFLAIAKGVAYFFSGSGAMFATSMHSLADALNQGFVFIGSVLAEKKPTPRFPTGFGRVINIFCMVAVIIVSIMAYETILEGWHLIQHPAEVDGIWINLIVLALNIFIDGAILYKVMKEINTEAGEDVSKGGLMSGTIRNLSKASPPTRLVFYEDMVAVSGAILALIAVLVTYFSNFDLLDGIATIIIGFLMVGVAFRVGYDNMVGLIGVAAPKEVEDKVAEIILSDEDVTDINKLRILQEGRNYHVEAYIELRKGLALSVADDIKLRVQDTLRNDPNIADVTLGIIEDDDIKSWNAENEKEKGEEGS